jgi:DNA phosphorothioation-dependent restriction protein DptG
VVERGFILCHSCFLNFDLGYFCFLDSDIMKFWFILVLMMVSHRRHRASQLLIWDLDSGNFCSIFLQFRTLSQVNECTTNIEAFNKSKVTIFCRCNEHMMLISC